MIPACKDPPAPVSPRAPLAQRSASKDSAGSFDDALRESGSEPVSEKAESLKDGGAERPEKKSDDANAAAASPQTAVTQSNQQPGALDALLAQVLPPQQQQPAEDAPAPQTPVRGDPSAKLTAAALAQANPAATRDIQANQHGATNAPDVAVAASGANVARPAERQVSEGENAGEPPPRVIAPDVADAAQAADDASPSRSSVLPDSKIVPGSTPGEGRGSAGKQGGGDSDAPFRPVEVRQVSSTTHFPVVADPVRQIASEVTRALEDPAATPGASALTDPSAPQPVKTLQVQLEPEALGTVTLRLRLSGNHLSVRVDVAEPATLDMIQREHDRLQKSMTSDHVSIDRLEIRPLAPSAPVQNSESASGPKQDMNAQQGQQQRSQAEAGAGDGRGRDSRREQQGTGVFRNDRQDTASNRGGDSRSLYL